MRWRGLLVLIISGCNSAGCNGVVSGYLEPDFDLEPEQSCDIDPGSVTLHRLNRFEFAATTRDLFHGMSVDVANELPADDSGAGFDNNADVLSISPLLVDKYESAAEDLVDAALGKRVVPDESFAEAETLVIGTGETSAALAPQQSVALSVLAERPGRYRLRARFWTQMGTVETRFILNGDPVLTHSASATPQTVDVAVSVATTGLFEVENASDGQTLYVDWLSGEGPLDEHGDALARETILICSDETADCAADILGRFARRAWRRPVTQQELDELNVLAALPLIEGDTWEQGIRLGLQAVLLSPHFLFRVEPDAEPGETRELNDHELAARLSYFLWSSMPDDELRQLADEGALGSDQVLVEQVERMLDDPKSVALIESFGAQWLTTRGLDQASPSPYVFGAYDRSLRDSMRSETELFLAALLREDRPYTDLVEADFTFINDELAFHYDLPRPGTDQHVRVSTEGSPRAGIIGQASVLTVTSNPDRTSPVKRGKWLLEQVLCTPPPPPPPEVEGLPEGVDSSATLRERLEQHRANPECATCHQHMDPLGLALENFDGIGEWRERDENSADIDATGEFPDGSLVDGPRELAAHIAADPNLRRCVAEKLMTYAVGRGLESSDGCALDQIVEAHKHTEGSLRSLMELIVTSETFRTRRALPQDQP